MLAQISLTLSLSLSLSLSIRPNHPTLQAGLPDCILCPHRAVICKFLLVSKHWHMYMKGSIWVHPCLSMNVPHVFLVLFVWF